MDLEQFSVSMETKSVEVAVGFIKGFMTCATVLKALAEDVEPTTVYYRKDGKIYFFAIDKNDHRAFNNGPVAIVNEEDAQTDRDKECLDQFYEVKTKQMGQDGRQVS